MNSYGLISFGLALQACRVQEFKENLECNWFMQACRVQEFKETLGCNWFMQACRVEEFYEIIKCNWFMQACRVEAVSGVFPYPRVSPYLPSLQKNGVAVPKKWIFSGAASRDF